MPVIIASASLRAVPVPLIPLMTRKRRPASGSTSSRWVAPRFARVQVSVSDLYGEDGLLQTSLWGRARLRQRSRISGYPGHYAPAARPLLAAARLGLFASGHSYMLRVMPVPSAGLAAPEFRRSLPARVS